jgi:polysaccharide pyruvyl transferase WcaK-like protein
LANKGNPAVKRIIIWGGWYGSHNIGDQILLLTIADILGKTLEGNVHFTVLTDNPENIRAYTERYSKWDIQPLHNRRQFPAIVRAISSIEPVFL